ncbi:MAG: InlB B-repeat-containing protein, partial [Paludibacteraceae bacterium]|nr:InlB B-repeat-containing protein [Paludibacteraceae bacterium]
METDIDVEEYVMPTYDGATPTKTATAQYTYTFAGWTPEIVAATADAVYTATYTETLRSYTITYLDDNNQEISHETLNYGVMPTPATPTKANTAQYTYTFNQWVPALTTVTGDATYKASFTQTVNQYTLTVNGATGGGTYDYGTSVTLTPTPADNYHFTQWSDGNTDNPRTVTVTGNATYTAQSEEDTKTTVYLFPTVWDVDNAKFAAYVWEDGKAAAWSAVMTKTADGKAYTAQIYDYANIIFVRLNNTATSGNWDDKWNQTADLTRNTAYNCYQITGWDAADGFWRNYPFYFVEFHDYDATLLKTDTVDSGNAATAPADPTRVGYTFAGWDNQFNNVTADLTVTAQYTPNTNTAYTVRHMWQNINDNGYTEHESEAKTGTTGAQTAATAKTYTGFTAKAFSQAAIAADGSTVVDIYYDRKTYTITWKDGDNQTIETDQNVKYGATPTYEGATPTKTATAQYTYTFNGTWSPAISTVTGNATYTAQFDQAVNEYKITWKNEDGSVIDYTTVAYGVVPTHADATKVADAEYTYTFAG